DVLRAEVSQGTFDPEATIRFITTLPLDATQPKPTFELEPSVEGVRLSVGEREVRLEGPFVCGVRYAATLPGTLVSKDGKTLASARRLEFVVPDRTTGIRFPFSSGMLSPAGNMLLDAELVNLSSVSLEVSKVYANNLLAHLDGTEVSATSREFPAKVLKVSGPRNSVQKVALDLAACLGRAKGIYRIALSSEDSRWTRDTAIVAISDLAISAKSGRDWMLVWVTSVATGKPVAGAKVRVLSESNQVLAESTCDSTGVASLAVPHDHPDGKARVVVAEVANDTGFLELGGATDLLDRVDQSGRPTPCGYDIYLYTERGIYQPGEPVHVTGIIRDGGDGSTPAPFPLEVAVVRPDGREVAHVAAEADVNGLFHVQYDSIPSGHRGRYRFIARLPGATEVLGQASALIEEFVPPRIEVKAQAQTTEAGLEVEVAADYLFGMPGAGLTADIEARYVLARFEHPAFAGFTFDLPADIAFVPVVQERAKEVNGELGADGKTLATVPGPTAKGYWKASITSSVHETGGRTVSALASAIIDTQPLHAGLRLKDPASSVAPFGVEWVLIDPKGAVVAGRDVALRLVRVETDWTLEEVRGRLTWRSTQRETEVRAWNAAAAAAPGGVGGVGNERVSCDSGGTYRLYAKAGADAAAMLEIDVPWGQGEKARSQRPERVAVTLDHDDYEPGQTAKATIISPFAGQMLVTIESDRVLWSMVSAAQAGANLIDVPLPATLRGGAFLSVSVVRPIDVKSERWLPVSARGLARITTRHPAQRLEATLEVPSNGLPTSTQSVLLHTPAGVSGVAHVWAVDDGILLATAFKKPDPFAWFLAHRSLAVETEDAFRELLPDYKRPAEFTRIGGDGDSEEGVRGPMPRRVTLDGVLWNKAIALDPSGTTRIAMQLPDLTGRLRFFAVVVAGDRYQSLDQTLTLASPLMIEASMPMFIAPGDRLEVPVRLINSTKAPMHLTLSQQVVTGPVQLSGTPTQEVDVAPMTSALVWRTLTCSDEGVANLMFEAKTSDSAAMARARGEFTCRAAAGLMSLASVQAIKTGEVSTITLDPALDPAHSKVQVRIEPNPTVHLGPALDALVDYPHGCIEQTSSRLLALLEVAKASREKDPSRAQTIDAMIDAGINRIRSMQTAAGGLSYWPDSQNPDVWGTVYAADVLVRASAAGRRVDPKFLSDVTDYLAGRLGATRGEAAAIDDSTRAYLCDVLAQLGKPQPG
ncbi:MAG: MG2 domain-containing protein, partial [Planctomycetota bacterium]|nr:MG2 domain-containing protein [Planctomycetota bacterium]